MNGPSTRYQCVSQPGTCKFEWCCGPLCACNIHTATTEQGRKDTAEAERRQEQWRQYGSVDAATQLGDIAREPRILPSAPDSTSPGSNAGIVAF